MKTNIKHKIDIITIWIVDIWRKLDKNNVNVKFMWYIKNWSKGEIKSKIIHMIIKNHINWINVLNRLFVSITGNIIIL